MLRLPSRLRGRLPRASTHGLAALLTVALPVAATAQEGSFLIDGYGEVLYRHFDYGANQNLPDGSEPDSRATLDVRRFNLSFGAELAEALDFEVEIEFEHGGTGSALELEYEEFGEFEFEAEKGGEIQLEQIHLTKTFSRALALRVGEITVPVGLTNTSHIPIQYLGTVRPESEENIIPLTWHETGVAAFGQIHGLHYQIQVVNGLDATGFSSRNWVVEGKQQKFEGARATDLALAGRLEYRTPIGLRVGLSGYRGNSTGNRPKDDMDGVDGHVTIGSADLVYSGRRWRVRSGLLYGTVENADLISARNAALSRNIQSPRTPVAKAAFAWSGEVGFDVAPYLFDGPSERLVPFVRYERYDPMHETDDGVFDVPRFETAVTTVGASLFLTPGVVVKADYTMREVGKGTYNDENTFAIAVAFAGTFFSR